jgi:hypothetical protein
MTVADLIEELKCMPEDAEVRFASQPNWPFEYNIADVISVEIENRHTGEEEEVVYLAEGRQLGYLPSEAKEWLGW